MNNVVLMGRLTKDPEVRYSQNEKQTAVARFTLAVDRRFKRDGEPEADFIGCVAFGKTGEFVEKYLKKGTKIVLQGRIATGRYQDKDGKTVFTTDIIAENLEFAESKNAAGNAAAAPATQAAAPAPAKVPDEAGFVSMDDEDELPFS